MKPTRDLRRLGVCGAMVLCAVVSQAAHAQAQVNTDNCQLLVSDSDIDYGGVTRYQLESAANGTDVALGKRRVTLNVTCRTAVLIGIAFRGPAAGREFSFGSAGKIALTLSEAQMDGVPVMVGRATAADVLPSAPAGSARFVPNEVIVPVREGKPIRGVRLSATVDVDPTLPRGSARVASPTTMETHGSFQVLWR